MLKGLEEEKAPPDPIEGSAYTMKLPTLSDDMDDAIEDFEKSDFIADILGEELRRIYA